MAFGSGGDALLRPVCSDASQVGGIVGFTTASSVQRVHPIVENGRRFAASLLQGSVQQKGQRPKVLDGGGALLTVREVAARLRVSTATIYRLCDSGQLEHVRISNAIRVSEATLVAYLKRGGVCADALCFAVGAGM